jgi:hypothetical protein
MIELQKEEIVIYINITKSILINSLIIIVLVSSIIAIISIPIFYLMKNVIYNLILLIYLKFKKKKEII